MLHAKFQANWIIETDVMDEQVSVRFPFKMSFGGIYYIAHHPGTWKWSASVSTWAGIYIHSFLNVFYVQSIPLLSTLWQLLVLPGHQQNCYLLPCPDCKVYGANMGPTWILSGPGGPHVGPMNLAIWVQCHYNAVSFLQYLHKRHPIARPLGRSTGCPLWVSSLIHVLLQ